MLHTPKGGASDTPFGACTLPLQVGWALPTPDGLPVEAVPPDVCLAMVAAVPPEVDVGDIKAAKAAVQSTAAELQVWSTWAVSLHRSRRRQLQ